MRRIGASPTRKLFDNAQTDQWLNTMTERMNLYSGPADPTAAEIPENQWIVYKNTTTGTIGIWTKIGGIAIPISSSYTVPKRTTVKRATNQNIAHDTFTAISWDSVILDEVGSYSGGSPTRITVPPGFTRVRLNIQISWANDSTGQRSILVAKNGVYQYSEYTIYAAAFESSMNRVTRWMDVSPGDYLEVFVWQSHGGTSLNLAGTASVFGAPTTLQAEFANETLSASGSSYETPGWAAYPNVNQATPVSVNTKVVFDVEESDSHGAYDTTNSRFTVPSGWAGWYLISAGIGAPTNAFTANAAIFITKNGTRLRQIGPFLGSPTTLWTLNGTAEVQLAVGDYVEIEYNANGVGGSTAIVGGSGLYTYFQGVWLRP